MFELKSGQDGYTFSAALETGLVLDCPQLIVLETPDGNSESAKIEQVKQKGSDTRFNFAFSCGLCGEGFIVSSDVNNDAVELKLEINNPTNLPIEFALRINLQAAEAESARWMIPALFYKENCPASNVRRYPRYDPDQSNPEQWISPAWDFRSDRSSHPGVFLFSPTASAYIGTSAETDLGLSGLFFDAPTGQKARFGVRFPYAEQPRTYATCHDPEQKPVWTYSTLAAGQRACVKLEIAVGPADLHFYHPILKSRYERERQENPVNPWVGLEEGVRLGAEGLFRWHYDPRERVLYETCSFDGYFGLGKGIPGMPYVDRPHMHVGWVSGAPTATNLLAASELMKREDISNAARSVLDRIADEGLSPSGFFWSQWTHEAGWGTGWNPKDNWLQGRTAAEAVFFYFKALAMEKKEGRQHPNWEQAIKSNLEQVVRVQREDGNLGSYYDYKSGEVEVWEGMGSLIWIPALLEGAKYFGDTAYGEAAQKAGEYYSQFVEDEYLYGAPEDVHLTPTSEDGYNALMAYWALYRESGDTKMLALARKAADWTISFRWCYNLTFSPKTILGQYDFRSQGGDLASPCNQHLHPYGLICFPEMMELAKATGDDYYRKRALDHLACFLQFIAREDGDFGARLGMTPEQFYHTDWWQPKGHLLALAHAWTTSMVLYASLWSIEKGVQL